LDLLADRVGSQGRVVGLDADPSLVAMARELVADRALGNVEILVGDARHTGLDSGSFDVVHARTLLINVPEPEQVVREMVRLAKPGGRRPGDRQRCWSCRWLSRRNAAGGYWEQTA
jgi:ubiquinone/menaquinone biosynthesis C-methylase UbiE